MGQAASFVRAASDASATSATSATTRSTITTHVFIDLDALSSSSGSSDASSDVDARAREVALRLGTLRAALPGVVPHMVATSQMRASLRRVVPDAPFLARVRASSNPERALLTRYVDALTEDARSGTMAAIVVAQRQRVRSSGIASSVAPEEAMPGGGHLARAVRYHTPDARLAAGRLMYASVTDDGAGVIVEDASRFPLAFERRVDLDAFMDALQTTMRVTPMTRSTRRRR